MIRTNSLLWLLATLVMIFFSQCQSIKKPTVVIIYTDDQGTLDAACYGASDLITPNLDALARDGILFTQAYAHTVCCPSRAALLTGRYPQRSGINDWTQNNAHAKEKGINMALDEITLAEILKANGYTTALFGKWHLGGAVENGPLEQGFDEFFGFRGGFIENYTHYFLHGMGFHDLWNNKEEVFMRDQYFPALMTDRALIFMEEHQEEPFFIYAAFNLPHYPEQVDSLFFEDYKDLDEPRRSYARVVTSVDGRIGQLIDKLKELDLFDQTIVFYMSDNGHSTEDTRIRFDHHHSGLPKGFDYCAHGGGGYTGQWRGAKGSFFEGGIRVPAILSYPERYEGGQQRSEVISNLDLLPTICELTGCSLPDVAIDGYSMVPILASADTPSKHEVLYFQWEDQWAVREGRWKLIVNGVDETGAIPTPYLADLEATHPEKDNRVAAHPEIVNHLTKLYATWSAEVFK